MRRTMLSTISCSMTLLTNRSFRVPDFWVRSIHSLTLPTPAFLPVLRLPLLRLPLLGLLVLGLLAPSNALAADQHLLDANTLHALADKAQHASLRDQCYLYAQLIRSHTEVADREIAAGNAEASALALHSVELYAASLDAALAGDAKKLKDAEILLRESAFRLKAAMMASSSEDRPAMASALLKINASEARVMGAVFAH